MSFTAINTPLIALFSLAYGLGHPDVSAFRPALVDKTLSSFHEDLNRTAKEIQVGAQRVIDMRALMSAATSFTSPSSSSQAIVPQRQNIQPVAILKIEREEARFAQLGVQKRPMAVMERRPGDGFTALPAR